MGESDVDLVRRIYGFDWAAVGSRREGFSKLATLVTEDFTSQLSPELGERVVEGVRGLQEFTLALESDFSEFRYDADEFTPARDGKVIVLGTIHASARASRMPLTGDFGHVWIIRDGRAASVIAYRDRETAKQVAGV
jgi:hypothetical protein